MFTSGNGKIIAEVGGEYINIRKMGINMLGIGNKIRRMGLVNK